MIDEIEEAVVAAAVAALRRRAQRQRAISQSWTTHGAWGVTVRSGEAVIADLLAAALTEIADELEQGGAP
jgi:hypothetical protein